VHHWRVTQLRRLGIPRPLAQAEADHVDRHQIARLVQRSVLRGWCGDWPSMSPVGPGRALGRSWCVAAVSTSASGTWGHVGGRGAMMGTMGSAVGSDAVAGGVAGPGAGGVVSRPRLLGRLAAPARVIVVSAPPGSGKTVLLRSWIGQAGLAGHAAWVPAGRGERDPQRFWLSVTGALRQTAAGSVLVRPLTAAPDLDGGAIAERLLADLAPLEDRVWLVIDDVHELGPDALRQLELLLMRAPNELRFVLAARHDVRLGLHRLRLEGELAEIREPDLRFTVAEAKELFDAAGVDLPDPAPLVERTEGWAAGLRLAALSLAGHPDPERLAAEFSGTERTVAEYLLAEVLDRQGDQVRRLLLRTSILERVNGELAALLTGDEGAERVLQDLEAANAFVVAVDARRSWFRYHHLFADLLQLELRRTEPDQVGGLHRAASGWFAGHGYPVEAVRHAQAAQDWGLAARVLADNWPGLYLDGQAAVIHELLAGFPVGLLQADAGLGVVAAADRLARGDLDGAERLLDLAGPALAPAGQGGPVPENSRQNGPETGDRSAPGDHGPQMRILLGVVSMQLAHQRGNLEGVVEETRRLAAMTEAMGAARPGLVADISALAMISLGSAEFWASGQDAERHLEEGLVLGRQVGRPYLEFISLALQSEADLYESLRRAAERAEAAVALARRHGWDSDPVFGVACMSLAIAMTWQGRLDEAEPWIQGAERVMRAETHLAAAATVRGIRGLAELARGHAAEAAAAFEAADMVAGRVASEYHIVLLIRSLLVQSLARLGETGRAGQVLARLSQQDRAYAETRVAVAALRFAQDDPRAALAELGALVPALKHPGQALWRGWMALAAVLEAAAGDALGEPDTADHAIERALDLAEPDGLMVPFLLYPMPGLLDRHARHPTTHASLLSGIRDLLSGNRPDPLPPAAPQPLLEALSGSEIRVLRYLPTNLTGPEIAGELYVSHNTVRTHLRHLYAKLGTHRRAEAVARARALGLLAPSPQRGQAARAG
jgi:LuxR family transcriptional regulator, maltose regulon positive regulatory protein